MKYSIAFALACATSAVVLAVPVRSQDIVVTSDRTVPELVADLSRDLDRQLNIALRAYPSDRGEGIAQVRFLTGGNGKPRNVSLYRNSGNATVDQAALRAVSRMSSLHPLPSEITAGQIFQANVLIANSQQSMNRLQSRLAHKKPGRFARAGSEVGVITLGVSVIGSN